MRISVECGGFTRAADACLTANQTSAVLVTSLVERLVATSGMAGNDATSADFASAYDAGAREAVAALADLTHAFIGAGRLLTATGANHESAESSAGALAVLGYSGDGLHESAYVRVRPDAPPPSLGDRELSLSGVDAWILDQVEGFVWPGADVDRLRIAATAWRRAAASTAGLADEVDIAIRLVEAQHSPEVPLAVDALRDLATLVGDTAWQLGGLANACEDYADGVEATRDRTRALLEEVAQMIVEGAAISVIVTGLTGGLGGAASVAAAAAKVRSHAPRFYALLTALRAGVAATAARLERVRTELRALRARVEKFLRVPARNEVGAMKRGPLGIERRLETAARNLADPRLFDPQTLHGLSPREVEKLLVSWQRDKAGSGIGTKFVDPQHPGRQIRVMEGYAGNRPDLMTHGPYVVVSQNGIKTKIPLEGNPLL